MKAPRPLPLFLELVRQVSQHDGERARQALHGLNRYETAHRTSPVAPKRQVASVGAASLRDHGGEGPPAVLIPSLINPPSILDLDPHVSLASAVARMGRRVLLLDWGKAQDRSEYSVAGHVEHLLLPLLRSVGEPAALIGYCLGGTMAIAAAALADCQSVVTLAAPWNFAHYPQRSRDALKDMWRNAGPAARELGALPMEVLQAAFWSLDPERTVTKFAEFGLLDPATLAARRFVQLEDWANEGEPLPFPAAEELIEGLFGQNLPGAGQWDVAGSTVTDLINCPVLHVTADHDRIAPASTAASGPTVAIPAGHVGMIVGSARTRVHEALQAFLAPCPSGPASLSRRA